MEPRSPPRRPVLAARTEFGYESDRRAARRCRRPAGQETTPHGRVPTLRRTAAGRRDERTRQADLQRDSVRKLSSPVAAAGSDSQVWRLHTRGCGFEPEPAPGALPSGLAWELPSALSSLAVGACGPQGRPSPRPSACPSAAFLRAAESTVATMESWMLLGPSAASAAARGLLAAASRGGVGLWVSFSGPPVGQAGWGAHGGAADAGAGTGRPGRDRGRPPS